MSVCNIDYNDNLGGNILMLIVRILMMKMMVIMVNLDRQHSVYAICYTIRNACDGEHVDNDNDSNGDDNHDSHQDKWFFDRLHQS